MSTSAVEKILCFRDIQLQFLKIYDVGYANRTGVPEIPTRQFQSWTALHYTVSGHGKLFLNDLQFLIKKGDWFYIPAGSQVKLVSNPEDPLEYYWMSFYPAYTDEIREVLSFYEKKPIRPANSKQRVAQIFSELLQANTPSAEVYFTALSALMQIFASEFTQVDTNPNNVRYEELVENTKQIIERNYTDNSFTIQDTANILHINHPQMSRIFKEVMGQTPVSYLINLRLSYASELLKNKPYSVSEVCDASGFSNEWHFMKQFKKKYGMTVKEYRQLHGQKQSADAPL